MTAKLFAYDRFQGVNNVDRPHRFPIDDDVARSAHPLRFVETAENVDVDNSFMLVTRPGTVKKLTGTAIHSMWASESLAFLVDADVLYGMDSDYAKTALLSGIVGRISYARQNDRVYLTDGRFIGYHKDGAVTALTDPGVEFKAPLPAGQKLFIHGTRLMVASGKVLYIGDPLCDHYDIRTGFRVFESRIVMGISVREGFYVSDQGDVWFIHGVDPEEFKRDHVFDYPAIDGTESIINGSNLMKAGQDGDFAIWTSTAGICVGDGAGNAKNLTRERYKMGTHGIGCAVIREVDGVVHYLAALE